MASQSASNSARAAAANAGAIGSPVISASHLVQRYLKCVSSKQVTFTVSAPHFGQRFGACSCRNAWKARQFPQYLCSTSFGLYEVMPHLGQVIDGCMAEYDYTYSWGPRLKRWPASSPLKQLNRLGQPCRVLARGALNSALIEFEDGCQSVVSRNALRKRKPAGRGV